MIYLPNPTLFSPSHPTSKHFDPYHESNKWRFGWLSHVIQGYQTGILHHRSAREKVTTMHLTRSSWCCICSARSTHCSSYETGLHSLHRQPKQCHWILNLAAQAVDVHEGRLSRSKFLSSDWSSASVSYLERRDWLWMVPVFDPSFHRLTTIREGQTNSYDMVLPVLWPGQVHPRKTVGSQLVFSEQQLSKYSRMITVIRSGLVVNWSVQPCQGRHKIHLSQNDTSGSANSNGYPFQSCQNLEGKAAKTIGGIVGKAAKPMCGVVNDCRTVASMKALMVPHFRHIIY